MLILSNQCAEAISTPSLSRRKDANSQLDRANNMDFTSLSRRKDANSQHVERLDTVYPKSIKKEGC